MTDLELAKVIDAARDEVVVQRNAALAEVARLTRDPLLPSLAGVRVYESSTTYAEAAVAAVPPKGETPR